jgi:hypothetical protein
MQPAVLLAVIDQTHPFPAKVPGMRKTNACLYQRTQKDSFQMQCLSAMQAIHGCQQTTEQRAKFDQMSYYIHQTYVPPPNAFLIHDKG